MQSAGTVPEPGFLSLPEDLFYSIVSILNVRDASRLGVVSKAFHDLLLKPGRVGPCMGRLDFDTEFGGRRPPSLEASRLSILKPSYRFGVLNGYSATLSFGLSAL